MAKANVNVTPQRMEDGRWQVAGTIFDTNAQAWRWIDRQSNEPVSRSEDTGDWAFQRSMERAFNG